MRPRASTCTTRSSSSSTSSLRRRSRSTTPTQPLRQPLAPLQAAKQELAVAPSSTVPATASVVAEEQALTPPDDAVAAAGWDYSCGEEDYAAALLWEEPEPFFYDLFLK
jgi:EREBP-like factor